MAWYAIIDSVQEINTECVIDATVEERDNGNVLRSYPYHVTYSDVGSMTLAQMKADVEKFAAERASEGTAIDALKAYIGDTISLSV